MAAKNTGCQVSVARAMNTPVANQRRWTMASSAARRKSTMVVFSRGP